MAFQLTSSPGGGEREGAGPVHGQSQALQLGDDGVAQGRTRGPGGQGAASVTDEDVLQDRGDRPPASQDLALGEHGGGGLNELTA